jgi:hypothetical protein
VPDAAALVEMFDSPANGIPVAGGIYA